MSVAGIQVDISQVLRSWWCQNVHQFSLCFFGITVTIAFVNHVGFVDVFVFQTEKRLNFPCQPNYYENTIVPSKTGHQLRTKFYYILSFQDHLHEEEQQLQQLFLISSLQLSEIIMITVLSVVVQRDTYYQILEAFNCIIVYGSYI